MTINKLPNASLKESSRSKLYTLDHIFHKIDILTFRKKNFVIY